MIRCAKYEINKNSKRRRRRRHLTEEEQIRQQVPTHHNHNSHVFDGRACQTFSWKNKKIHFFHYCFPPPVDKNEKSKREPPCRHFETPSSDLVAYLCRACERVCEKDDQRSSKTLENTSLYTASLLANFQFGVCAFRRVRRDPP